jgi:hypothetical protein
MEEEPDQGVTLTLAARPNARYWRKADVGLIGVNDRL